MAARLRSLILTRPSPLTSSYSRLSAQRSFQTSRRCLQDGAPIPQKKPIGAFRGTLMGFLLGSVMAGSGLYYYVIEDYKVSNDLLTEDIYALQTAVQRLEGYVKNLEEGKKMKK